MSWAKKQQISAEPRFVQAAQNFEVRYRERWDEAELSMRLFDDAKRGAGAALDQLYSSWSELPDDKIPEPAQQVATGFLGRSREREGASRGFLAAFCCLVASEGLDERWRTETTRRAIVVLSDSQDELGILVVRGALSIVPPPEMSDHPRWQAVAVKLIAESVAGLPFLPDPETGTGLNYETHLWLNTAGAPNFRFGRATMLGYSGSDAARFLVPPNTAFTDALLGDNPIEEVPIFSTGSGIFPRDP